MQVRTLHEIGLENTARNLPNVSEDIKGKISTLGATPLQQSPGSRSWNQPRNRCAETKFASKYYKLLKVSPFAKEQTPQSSP
uniref:Uncharacterized protein n=1 Tax=Chromera velia CCMP2878 TaxID=1169474 RepID=A0A0G4F1R3_9ALVE|eukprot:Cvel_2624.t1-p1 / transcript=Cvel_2624.t1 / gene=Cvel_2624 / organism=Chromera_velia_CCMP2878 / gene_product=hypothetical protein / transcript_product=hypothetical protein / location=Cvel_scaffold104:24677-26032(+) / protein_length=81 / sequence_SO=supercontig / SO=protein_coding / is_pseudo=false